MMTINIKELSAKMNEASDRAVRLGLHTAEGSAAASQYATYRQQLTSAKKADRYAKQVAKQSTK